MAMASNLRALASNLMANLLRRWHVLPLLIHRTRHHSFCFTLRAGFWAHPVHSLKEWTWCPLPVLEQTAMWWRCTLVGSEKSKRQECLHFRCLFFFSEIVEARVILLLSISRPCFQVLALAFPLPPLGCPMALRQRASSVRSKVWFEGWKIHMKGRYQH